MTTKMRTSTLIAKYSKIKGREEKKRKPNSKKKDAKTEANSANYSHYGRKVSLLRLRKFKK